MGKRKIDNILEMGHRRAKQSEIWDSRVVTSMWGTFLPLSAGHLGVSRCTWLLQS